MSTEGTFCILRDKKWLDNLLWYSKVYVKKIIEKKRFWVILKCENLLNLLFVYSKRFLMNNKINMFFNGKSVCFTETRPPLDGVEAACLHEIRVLDQRHSLEQFSKQTSLTAQPLILPWNLYFSFICFIQKIFNAVRF